MRKAPVDRFLVFISIWSVVVYSPIARWTWHPQGWSRMRGVMDFAGGTAVHVCSGATVAAHCIFFQMEVRGWSWRNLGSQSWRRERKELIKNGKTENGKLENGSTGDPDSHSKGLPDGVPQVAMTGAMPSAQTQPQSTTQADGAPPNEEPSDAVELERSERQHNLRLEMQHLDGSENHSVTNVVLGTTLLWVGWFGFNGGSALGANLRAASAILATHVAACAGGSVGLILEWLFVLPTRALRRDTGRDTSSILGFCDGAISGLVAITPAAGFVSFLWGAS